MAVCVDSIIKYRRNDAISLLRALEISTADSGAAGSCIASSTADSA